MEENEENHSKEWNAERLSILRRGTEKIKLKYHSDKSKVDVMDLIKNQPLSKASNKDAAYQNKIRKRKLKKKR